MNRKEQKEMRQILLEKIEETGEKIPMGRLKFMLWTTTCVNCA